MIQKESGLDASQRWNLLGFPVLLAEKNISPATATVGIRAAYTSKNTRNNEKAIVTTARIRRRRMRFRAQSPSASILILKYGMTINATMTSVGIRTPATTGGK